MSQAVRRIAAVKARTGMSRSSIYAAIKAGDFPAPIALGRRAVGWLDADITAWIESRPKARRAPVAKKQTGGA